MKRKPNSLFPRLIVYVFIIMTLTLAFMGAITSLAFHLGLFSLPIQRRLWLILALLLISIVISSFFTILIGRRILLPISALISATKKVARGDFSVRLDENYSETEIREMNIHFNKMIRELGGLETLRNDFIVNVSHEFKTPISSIEGYATLLQDPELSEEERSEYAEMILDSARKLSSLSGNILKLSKFETQEIFPEKSHFSLDEQLRQAILLLESKWSKKNLDMDLELPSVAYYGNEEYLMQVWLNIFGNAIKFTPENGCIKAVLKKYDDGVSISISDSGYGMTEEVKKRIFEKFYQGDPNRSSEGNGLGLTLVKRIVDLSGGTITVDTEPSKGTTFVVWLPI